MRRCEGAELFSRYSDKALQFKKTRRMLTTRSNFRLPPILRVGLAVLLLIYSVPQLQAQSAKTKKVTFKIGGQINAQGALKGMMCDGCKRLVQNALEKVDGVLKVDVILQENKCTVEFDPRKVKVEDLQRAVAETKVFIAQPVKPSK